MKERTGDQLSISKYQLPFLFLPWAFVFSCDDGYDVHHA